MRPLRVIPREKLRPPATSGGPRPRAARRAHTLTELLVVLTILTLFAGIVMPRLASALIRSHLEVAIERVQSGFSYTRARAVATGLRHQVAFNAQTREIVAEPFRPELTTQGATTTVRDDDPSLQPALRTTLPEEVQVVEWTVIPMEAGMQGGRTTYSTSTADAPLVSYPEGMGDSARVVLEDEEGRRRGVILDGFTGEIRELEPEELSR
ncbi:MAG: hypothetical protein ACK47B_14005 [Armatimonadota bacterium]